MFILPPQILCGLTLVVIFFLALLVTVIGFLRPVLSLSLFSRHRSTSIFSKNYVLSLLFLSVGEVVVQVGEVVYACPVTNNCICRCNFLFTPTETVVQIFVCPPTETVVQIFVCRFFSIFFFKFDGVLILFQCTFKHYIGSICT